MDCLLTIAANYAVQIYIALGVVFLTILYNVMKNRGLPPGPVGLPILGYYPFFDSDTCHLQMEEMGKKYGRVFSFMCTGSLFVNLGSIKAIKEALVTKSDCFAQRLEEPNLLKHHLDGGVVFLNGEPWKMVKKFLMQQLRERGMTTIKDSLSGPVYDSLNEVVEKMRKTNGQSVNVVPILLANCNNILRQTIFGSDGITEDEMVELVDAYAVTTYVLTGTKLLATGNIAKYFVLPYGKGMEESRKGLTKVNGLLQKAFDRRKATYDENNIRDIFDAYIKERNDRIATNDPIAPYLTDKLLVISLNQIVGDGTYSLAIFIAAFMKALVSYPEQQSAIYKELVEVVGEDRNPTIEDKSKMPYTNAFISEVLRCYLLLNHFPTLSCTKDTTLSGYKIPKGAVLLYNFWMAHMNPDDYKHPEKFDPTRFIPKDGKRPELPVAFGVGKRACLGEGFSMIQIFLNVTTLLKHFTFKKPDNVEQDDSFMLAHEIYARALPRN